MMISKVIHGKFLWRDLLSLPPLPSPPQIIVSPPYQKQSHAESEEAHHAIRDGKRGQIHPTDTGHCRNECQPSLQATFFSIVFA